MIGAQIYDTGRAVCEISETAVVGISAEVAGRGVVTGEDGTHVGRHVEDTK